MSYVLGPRVLHYVMKDKTEGHILVTIESQPDRALYVGSGETLARKVVRVMAKCDWFTREMVLPGEDDLQAIFRAMTAMDIYIQKICRDNEVEVFGVEIGDVRRDLDIFR